MATMASKQRPFLTGYVVPAVFALSFVAGQTATLITGNGRWSFLDFSAVGLALFSGIRFFRTGRVPGLFIPALVFAGTAGAEVFVFRRGTGSAEWLYIARWLSYAGTYAYVVSDRYPGRWKRVLYAAGVALAGIGLLQLLSYPDLRNLMYLGWDPHYRRVFATLFDPNFAGIIYVLTFIAGLSVWQALPKYRPAAIASQTVIASALFLTYSRSSILAFGGSMAVWCVLRRKFRLLAVSLIAGMAILFLLSGKGEGQNFLRSASSEARMGSMRIGLAAFTASPVVGTGFTGGTLSVLPAVPPSRAGTVDASLLFVLSAGGLLAAAAYAWILWRLWGIARRASAASRGNDPLLLSLVAVLIHSLLINSLFYPWVMAWIWILAAGAETVTADISRAS